MERDVDLAYLSRLRFVTRKRRRGGTWGERRSTRRGTGLEFADYRDYAPGDDPRRVDWNLYARLDRPYVRLYEEEEDLAVSVLLDGSASMQGPFQMARYSEGAGPEESPPESMTRWSTAQHIATALGRIALLGGDVLIAALLRGGKARAQWGPARGRGQLLHWDRWSEGLRAAGEAGMGAALRDFAAQAGRPGLVLLITDGYDPPGLAGGVAALAGRGHEVVLLHVLMPEELAPTLRGDLRLVDSETGGKREVTVDGAALAAYRRRLDAWQTELRALMSKHGGRYALLETGLPLRRLLLESLRHAGIVR